MAEIKRIGIKLKVYRFELRRKFINARSYRIKQKSPLQKLQESLRKKEDSKGLGGKKATASTGLNTPIIAAAVFLGLLLLGGAYMYFSFQSATTLAPPSELPVKPHMESEIQRASVVTAGDRTANQYVAYVQAQMETEGIAYYGVAVTPYSKRIPGEIWVLTGEKEDEEQAAFITALRNELGAKKRVLGETDIHQLEQAPIGAIVVVPTGAVPKELLGIDSKTDVKKLMKKGFVIIYIGLPFTNMMDGDRIVPTPRAVLQQLDLHFEEGAAVQSEEDFSLYQPLYKAGGLGAAQLYGSVSVLMDGDGAVLFLPQTLNGGWRGDMESAARDAARVILETRWADSMAEPREYFVVPEEGESVQEFFTFPIEKDTASLKLEFLATDQPEEEEEAPIVQEEWKIVHAAKETGGDLYIARGYAVTPTYISKDTVRMNAKLTDVEGEAYLYLSLSNASGEVGERESLGQRSLLEELSFDIPILLGGGEYVASLMDDQSRLYAQTYMEIPSIDISFLGSRDRTIYQFGIYKGEDEEELSGEVIVDEDKYGSYTFENTAQVEVDVRDATGGDPLPYGDHIFTFRIGEFEQQVLMENPAPSTPFSNPLFIGTIVMAVVVIGVGFYFARKEQILYQLDVPDFPAVARTKIPLPPETILGTFEKINMDYRWENTPLTISEVKNGFKGILYQGRPIFISDYNAEYLMDQLEARNLVGSFLGYYAPQNWTEKTRQNIRYLCLFRKLRDIMVNNAVPFTGRGEEKNCDSRITIVGQEMSVQLFNGFGDEQIALLAGNTLTTVARGITIILFVNGEEKREFAGMLASTSPALLFLKMEVEGGSVMLLTLEEFEKMIREFKAF